jgi:predicted RND superfamily exporter protein
MITMIGFLVFGIFALVFVIRVVYLIGLIIAFAGSLIALVFLWCLYPFAWLLDKKVLNPWLEQRREKNFGDWDVVINIVDDEPHERPMKDITPIRRYQGRGRYLSSPSR